MTQHLLADVLKEFCRQAGLAPVEAKPIVESGELQLRRVAFSAISTRISGVEEIVLQADFGLVPEARSDACMRRLLEINLALLVDGATFGINSVTGRVSMSCRVAAANMDVATMILTLEKMAIFAECWRETGYLDCDKTSTPVSLTPQASGLAVTDALATQPQEDGHSW